MRCGVEDAREADIARRCEGINASAAQQTCDAIKCVFVHGRERAIPNDERSHFLEGRSQ